MSDERAHIQRLRRKMTLGGNITVAEVGKVHELLTPMLGKKAKVTMDLRAVERIDTAALQVLVAFQHEARKQQIAVVWEEPNENVITVARRVGLLDALGLESRPVR